MLEISKKHKRIFKIKEAEKILDSESLSDESLRSKIKSKLTKIEGEKDVGLGKIKRR